MQALRLRAEERRERRSYEAPVTRFRKAVPGIIAGAADLDPAAVLTATVAGASFGYSLGWVILLCIPVLFTVLAVSSRIGQQTRKGLVQLVREHYGAKSGMLIALFMVSVNMAMIIGDVVAVSDSVALVLGMPRTFFLAIVGFTVWYLLIIGNYQKITTTLGALALVLVCYTIAAIKVTPSAGALAHGLFLPHIQMNGAYLMGVVAVFGSLLTPDVIVWQTSSRRGLSPGLARAYPTESHAGTFVACLISLSVLITASRLHVADPTSMSTHTASLALSSFGTIGPLLFSIGIIASGLIALPILVASLCFSVAEAFDWKSGLAAKPWEANRFYVMISVGIFIAVIVDYVGVNTVQVLYWSQVLAGVVLVPIFAFILLLANDRRIMRTTNSRAENIWLGLAAVGMLISTLLFFWTEFFR
jgi:Mn2+/Fe2+ NRAMP family transporter